MDQIDVKEVTRSKKGFSLVKESRDVKISSQEQKILIKEEIGCRGVRNTRWSKEGTLSRRNKGMWEVFAKSLGPKLEKPYDDYSYLFRINLINIT